MIDGPKSKDSNSGCNEGMASLISNEAWSRLVPDTPGTRQNPYGSPSYSGPLFAMEMSHTFGLVVSSEAESNGFNHSKNTEADCPASGSCPYPSPSKQSIIDAATTAAIAGGSNITVLVCYAGPGTTCSGNTDTGNNARGQTVTVVVSSDVNLVLPSLLGRSSFNLSGSSTMVVNH